MNDMHKSSKYKNTNNDLQFLMIAGKEDPCTGGEKGTASSIKTLEKAGFKNITRIDYEGMRHEILNEDEKEKVYKDVVEFIEKRNH
jgi:alpha-beta hydrolase superfamily lysophospholipase